MGLKILPYLDDWLVCALSRQQAVRDMARLLAHMAHLGLSVNLKKRHLEPAQRVTYLGVDLDFATMKAHLSSRQVGNILDSLVPFTGGRVVSYMQVLHLVGRLTAASSVVPLDLLKLRPQQRWVNTLHLDEGRHRHRKVRVSQRCVLALAPWRLQAFLSQGVPMGSIPSRREVVTVDACHRGWGVVWQRRTTTQGWSILCPP